MVDGEITACMDCGLVLEDSQVDLSGDYFPHKIKAKTASKNHLTKMSALINVSKVVPKKNCRC